MSTLHQHFPVGIQTDGGDTSVIKQLWYVLTQHKQQRLVRPLLQMAALKQVPPQAQCFILTHQHIIHYDALSHSLRTGNETAPKTLSVLLDVLGIAGEQAKQILDHYDRCQPLRDYMVRTTQHPDTLTLVNLIPAEQNTFLLTLSPILANSPVVQENGGINLDQTSSTLLIVREAWQRVVLHSPIPTTLLDSEGTIVKANLAFHNLTGLPIKNEDGTPQGAHSLLSVLLHHDRTTIQNALHTALQHPNNPAKAVEVKLSLEPEITALLYLNPMRHKPDSANPDARTEGCLAYLINTTEYKHLEQRFVQAQKMQAVGQLAGGIAHDFNNLLTAIIGFCDLLLIRHPPGEQSFADIMQIKQNANRAANLVRQLLAFSRKQTLQPQVIDITDTLSELSNLLRRLLGERITLKVKHSRDLWSVKVDESQLEQVIINLAVNARDAMEHTQDASLSVTTENIHIDQHNPLPLNMVSAPQDNDVPYGDYVLVTVIDTGHGIPQNIIRNIFEPFFTTKKVGEGTGLGLATAYGIIQQTGGHLFVSSEQGKGTTFFIYLPRYKDEVGAQKHVPAHKEIETPGTDLTGAGCILIVEDEDAVRMFSSRAMQNKGYKVLEADSAEVALGIIEEHQGKIDLIVTDVMMPGMTGPDMAKEVLKKYPDIKIIFMSGYGEDAFLDSFGEAREFYFLAKPFTLNKLASKVKEVLDKPNTL